MTRSELKARVAAHFGLLTAEDIEASVAVLLEAIATAMAEGGRAELRGFGTFFMGLRAPRTGRNPKTGAQVGVPAKRVPRFKAATALRERVAVPGRAPAQPAVRADAARAPRAQPADATASRLGFL